VGYLSSSFPEERSHGTVGTLGHGTELFKERNGTRKKRQRVESQEGRLAETREIRLHLSLAKEAEPSDRDDLDIGLMKKGSGARWKSQFFKPAVGCA
jgi:hypothetical protein